MEFEPTEYVRKSFNVKAVEVTYENIEAVAAWCKGRIDQEATKVMGGNEVKLPVVKFPGQGEDKGRELMARLGCFIVYSKGRFRLYKAPQFHAAFERIEQVSDEALDAAFENEEAKLSSGHDNSSVDGQETVHVSL